MVKESLTNSETATDNSWNILFEISSFSENKSLIYKLLESCRPVDLLVSRGISDSEIESFKELRPVAKSLRILFLENKNHPCEDLLESLPFWLRPLVHFVYLPSRNSADCLMNPHEAMERIELRRTQCQSQGLDFRVVSFGLSYAGFSEGPLKDFYENPCADTFAKYTEKENFFRYLFLLGVRKLGLAGLFGFIFWTFKVLLNPKGYNIDSEFKGWARRLGGWLSGLCVDVAMLGRRLWGSGKSFGVRCYWSMRRFSGASWKIQVSAQAMFAQRWKLKVFALSFFSQTWKAKVFIRSCISQRWKVRVYFQSLIGQRWKIKVFFIKYFFKIKASLEFLFGQSWRLKVFVIKLNAVFFGNMWRLKVFFQYLMGQTWRITVTLQRFKGFLKAYSVVLGWKIHAALRYSYWVVIRMVHMILNTAMYPFKKVYWFTSYQYRTRILRSPASESVRDT